MIVDIDKIEELILHPGYSLNIVGMSTCTAIIDRFNNGVHEQTSSVTNNQSLSFSQYLTEQRFLIAVSLGSLDFQIVPIDSTIQEIVGAESLSTSLTGFISGSGALSASDSILTAFNKLDGNDTTNLNAAKAYADSLELGLLDYRGHFDASVNTFPTTGGSGTSGAIVIGDLWVIDTIATSGSLLGYPIGSVVWALVNTPGQTAANWDVLNTGIAYIAENSANKSTSVATDAASDTKYPSVKATVTAFSAKNDYTNSFLMMGG